jgi:hypothetical protein
MHDLRDQEHEAKRPVLSVANSLKTHGLRSVHLAIPLHFSCVLEDRDVARLISGKLAGAPSLAKGIVKVSRERGLAIRRLAFAKRVLPTAVPQAVHSQPARTPWERRVTVPTPGRGGHSSCHVDFRWNELQAKTGVARHLIRMSRRAANWVLHGVRNAAR